MCSRSDTDIDPTILDVFFAAVVEMNLNVVTSPTKLPVSVQIGTKTQGSVVGTSVFSP